MQAATRRPGTWSREALADYGRAMARPGAAAAALGYYRAAVRSTRRSAAQQAWPPVRCPTLVIWGLQDPSLGPELIAPDRLEPLFAPGVVPRVVTVPDAGHFVQHEAERGVGAALVCFLTAGRPTAAAPEG